MHLKSSGRSCKVFFLTFIPRYVQAQRLTSLLSGVGPLPMVSKGTHIIIPLVEHLEDERWEAKVVEETGNKMKLSVNSPATAVIGLYGLSVTTSSLKGEAPTTYTCSENITMLFNPWCEGKEASRGVRAGRRRGTGKRIIRNRSTTGWISSD